MALDDLIKESTPEGEENPFLSESRTSSTEPVKKDRVVRADLSVARFYEDVTEEEAKEQHKSWVFDIAEEIENHFDNVKITDWTALDCFIYVPGEDYAEPFWLEEE